MRHSKAVPSRVLTVSNVLITRMWCIACLIKGCQYAQEAANLPKKRRCLHLGTVRLLESWHKGIGSVPSLQPCQRFSALESTRASADNCASSPPRCPCSPTGSGSASDASYVSESPPQPARQAAPGVLFCSISNLPSASLIRQSDLLAQTCLRRRVQLSTQRGTLHLAAPLHDPAACANKRFVFTSRE